MVHTDTESCCSTPETNMILHGSYASILKMNLKKKKRKQVQNSTKESDDAVNKIRDKGSRIRK